MSPPDAKRVSGGVGVDLVALQGLEGRSRLQQARAKFDGLVMCKKRVVDMEIQVDLLLLTLTSPLGSNMVSSKLDAHTPRSVGGENAVKVRIVVDDPPSEDRSPKVALSADICGIKNGDDPDQFHPTNLRDIARVVGGAHATLGLPTREVDYPHASVGPISHGYETSKSRFSGHKRAIFDVAGEERHRSNVVPSAMTVHSLPQGDGWGLDSHTRVIGVTRG